MKKMRKIFAVLLTLAMVLGMSMTAFAADAKAIITLKNFDKANKVEYMQIIQKDETKTSGWAFTNGAGACFTEAFGLTDSDDLHANNKRTMLTRAKENTGEPPVLRRQERLFSIRSVHLLHRPCESDSSVSKFLSAKQIINEFAKYCEE